MVAEKFNNEIVAMGALSTAIDLSSKRKEVEVDLEERKQSERIIEVQNFTPYTCSERHGGLLLEKNKYQLTPGENRLGFLCVINDLYKSIKDKESQKIWLNKVLANSVKGDAYYNTAIIAAQKLK